MCDNSAKEIGVLMQVRSPGQEGPSFAPPPLPEGWIAQWDGLKKQYYYVGITARASQWEVPIYPAPTGPTPQATPDLPQDESRGMMDGDGGGTNRSMVVC